MPRILAIHAHPDDLEIHAGGTLALLAAAGHTIAIVTMTAGDCGSAEYTSSELATMRRREAASSAALIGADYECAGFFDLAIFDNDESRRRVTEILRRFRPALIISAPLSDYMADHETTGKLVRDGCFAAPIPLYRTGSEQPAAPLDAIPHLYFTSAMGEATQHLKGQPADFGIDVETVFDMKKRMLCQHASQRRWLAKQHGIDNFLDSMEQATRIVGSRWGVNFGEEFQHHTEHPFPTSAMLQTLLAPVIRKEHV
jgi:N-acetylglucosamine malate deacetylase 1